jgi:oligopeptide transport system substrate-binding protein
MRGMAGGRGALAFAGLASALGGLLALSRPGEAPRADFAFNLGTEVTTLDPGAVTGVPEGRVLRALFEGLVRRDPLTLQPRPAAAEAWETDESGTVYTFHLRPGARWSNGDPLRAEDFEWSFRRLLEPETAAPYAYLLWPVVGARELNTGLGADGRPAERDWARVGIRALDERRLRIELRQPSPHFLDVLAFYALMPVHRPSLEAARAGSSRRAQVDWLRPGRLVSNGPFVLAGRRINDRIRMTRNPLYWDADGVAFRTLDALVVSSPSTALDLYLAGEIDWLDATLPPELVPRLARREDFHAAPYLATYFYRVNVTRPPLDDPRVRKALSLAIDREAICSKVLQAGQRPARSMVPWGGIGQYVAPRMDAGGAGCARELLAEAGWHGPGARELPPIEIHYNTADVHRDIAEVVAAGWKRELGIDVRLRNQEWKVYLDTQSGLAYDVSRSSWIADYADPATFLEIFETGGENNRTGWSDPRFDALLAAARAEADSARRNARLAEAEALLLEALPAIPIYWYVTQNLVNPRLGGFHANALNDPLPSSWYWMDDSELERRRAAQPPGLVRVPAPGPREGLHARAHAGPER